MAQIKWNKRATKQLADLQEYLLQEFSETTVKTFTSRLFKFLELLLKYPHLGSLENKKQGIRGFVLHRHTTILYKENQGSIYILTLSDSRQNPANTNKTLS